MSKIFLCAPVFHPISGVIHIHFYSSQSAYGLPDKIIFTVDIKKFKLPKSVTADINNTKPKEETKEKQGKITVVMSEYVINKGVSDDVFK